MKDFRPTWWENCTSSSNVSFPARIWGRKFVANYEPSQHLGGQSVKAEMKGRWVGDRYVRKIEKLTVRVTWEPNLIHNPNPATGKLAEFHEIRLGNVGEMIPWHELGHNYITSFLPMNHAIELYENHSLLFGHLQEFYAGYDVHLPFEPEGATGRDDDPPAVTRFLRRVRTPHPGRPRHRGPVPRGCDEQAR